ncbi:MAG: DegQ family serine endoprotease [Thiohalomonadaceae bacterium]
MLLLAGTLAAGTAQAALPALDSQGQPLPTLAPMLERTVPGVVNIFTRTKVPQQQHPLFSDPFFRHFFDLPAQPPERFAQSLGSGVIVDAKQGYVLTNHHVIDRAVEISVNLADGRSLTAELVGSDPETDVAVIQVKADSLDALPLADSDQLRVGDFVVAVGNPFGLGQTVTSGIVSALGRTGLGIEGYEDFIQTDASINPGNSGGALVNLRGELVGINTAILSRSGGNVGIGFAIPINMARDVMAQLVEHGEVRRGQLGAAAQDLTPDLASAFGLPDQRGAVVTEITPGSPADKAGLRSGDVILSVNGRNIGSAAELRNAVGLLRVGQKVEIHVNRNGKSLVLRAEVQEPPAVVAEGEKIHPRLAGAVVGDIVEGMPYYGKLKGVVVLEVAPASPAWRAGLRAGDVIMSANRQPTTDLGSLRKAVGKSRDLLLNIQRRGAAMFLVLR